MRFCRRGGRRSRLVERRRPGANAPARRYYRSRCAPWPALAPVGDFWCALEARFLPQLAGDLERVDADVLPPRVLAAGAVELAVVRAAERANLSRTAFGYRYVEPITGSGSIEIIGYFGFVLVRPEGACHQRRRVPPRELSIDLVADQRLGRVTGRDEAS